MIYNKLLIPLDGSAMAERALDYVPRVTSLNSILYLLSVLDESAIEMNTALFKRRRDYLTRISNRLQNQGRRTAASIEVGDVVTRILQRAEACDAIVMTAQGWTFSSRDKHSTVTRCVLSQTTRPVIVVPIEKMAAVEIYEPTPENEDDYIQYY